MKTILILVFSEIHRDPRVYRQVVWLKNHYKVITAAYGPSGVEDIDFIELEYTPSFSWKRLAYFLGRMPEKFYWSSPSNIQHYEKLKDLSFDLVIANDHDTLPLALRLAKDQNAKVIYDAHEYAPGEDESDLKFRLLNKPYNYKFCRKYLHQADVMLTVSEGLAKTYTEHFNVSPILLTNAPFPQNIQPSPVDENNIKLVHHGLAFARRQIERMIDMMHHLDERFSLHFLLVSQFEPDYYKQLKTHAQFSSRIHFHEPVPMLQIASTINQYDIGVYILPPTNQNQVVMLPNKLFEFLQARLAVAISPAADMATVVKKYNCGVIAEDIEPKSMANVLNQLTPEQITAFKQQSHLAAQKENADTNGEILKDIINTIFQNT